MNELFEFFDKNKKIGFNLEDFNDYIEALSIIASKGRKGNTIRPEKRLFIWKLLDDISALRSGTTIKPKLLNSNGKKKKINLLYKY